ncbi:MAG: hypothetical protein ACK5PP_20410 [Acidimicrobiales bacterium]
MTATDPAGRSDAAIGVDPAVMAGLADAWELLGRCGTWWTATQRTEAAARARDRFATRSTPPWLRTEPEAGAGLPDDANQVIDAIAANLARIDRAWAGARVDALGDGAYVELVGIVATVAMADTLATATGITPTPLPKPADELTPAQERPDGIGDIGAYVAMQDPFPYANVARALSLVPETNRMFRSAMVPMYSGAGMADLVWETPLTRPQVELVATRVAALHECFY